MNLLALLVLVFVFCIIYWAANKLMAAFGIGEPVHTIVIIVLVGLFLLALAGLFGYGPGVKLF